MLGAQCGLLWNEKCSKPTLSLLLLAGKPTIRKWDSLLFTFYQGYQSAGQNCLVSILSVSFHEWSSGQLCRLLMTALHHNFKALTCRITRKNKRWLYASELPMGGRTEDILNKELGYTFIPTVKLSSNFSILMLEVCFQHLTLSYSTAQK